MRYEIAEPTAKVAYYLLIEHRPNGDAVWIRSAAGRDPFVRSLLDAVGFAADNLDNLDQDDPEMSGALVDLATLATLVAAFIREGR